MCICSISTSLAKLVYYSSPVSLSSSETSAGDSSDSDSPSSSSSDSSSLLGFSGSGFFLSFGFLLTLSLIYFHSMEQ